MTGRAGTARTPPLRHTNLFRILGLLLVLTAAVLAACTGTRAVPAANQLTASDVAADYQLGPGDQVRITVYNQADLSGEYAVDGAGIIALPLLGPVDGAGRTPRELEQLLAARFVERNLLVDPSVAVQVVQFRPYYIFGEVGEPGAYPYSLGLTVRKAVAAAKGYTYRANTRRVYIQRSGEADEHLYELTPATAVLPGDTIRIPERIF